MAILQQIEKDAVYLRNLIATLVPGVTTVDIDGVKQTGEALERALESGKVGLRDQLEKLDLILESGVIPKIYKSPITKQTFYPSAEEAAQRKESLPDSKFSFFLLKNSRKKGKHALSKFSLIKPDAKTATYFFGEHKEDKKYPGGSCSNKVKKGFAKEDSNEPDYAIRIYHKDLFNGNTEQELRLAMRASYCYQQLGRNAYAFRDDKDQQFLVTDWIKGTTLNNASEQHIKSMPIERRIVMAISLLRELNILHQLGIIHRDIKPSNVMADSGMLKFSDLDSVGLKNEKTNHGYSPIYTKEYLASAQMSFDSVHDSLNFISEFNERTDIYAMGITLSYLFPDLISHKMVNDTINVTNSSVDKYNYRHYELDKLPLAKDHDGLINIFVKMVHSSSHPTLTTEELINDFKTVLETYPDFQKYLAEDKLSNFNQKLTPADGIKAFREIEIELLGYNQRGDVLRETMEKSPGLSK